MAVAIAAVVDGVGVILLVVGQQRTNFPHGAEQGALGSEIEQFGHRTPAVGVLGVEYGIGAAIATCQTLRKLIRQTGPGVHGEDVDIKALGIAHGKVVVAFDQ